MTKRGSSAAGDAADANGETEEVQTSAKGGNVEKRLDALEKTLKGVVKKLHEHGIRFE